MDRPKLKDSKLKGNMSLAGASIDYQMHLKKLNEYIDYLEKQLDEESYRIEHLINDTYQVIGENSGTVWKQGTLEECNEWVML